MFAVRKIIDGKLYATKTEDGSDSFTEAFTQWQDVEYVREFLKKQPSTLQFYGKGLKEATKIILRESQQFYLDILRIVRSDKTVDSLDYIIFKPLHKKDELNFPTVSTKAYGSDNNKSFLRLYAIRLSDGAYLVVGGLIKMYATMQESKEGTTILKKLESWTNFLHKERIDDSFDLGILVNEK